jgi:hypothetical protein
LWQGSFTLQLPQTAFHFGHFGKQFPKPAAQIREIPLRNSGPDKGGNRQSDDETEKTEDENDGNAFHVMRRLLASRLREIAAFRKLNLRQPPLIFSMDW